MLRLVVTPAAAGSLVNPASGGGNICRVDPGTVVNESNESNNDCTNTVTVVAPPSIAKAFGAASIPLNGTTTLTFHADQSGSEHGCADGGGLHGHTAVWFVGSGFFDGAVRWDADDNKRHAE